MSKETTLQDKQLRLYKLRAEANRLMSNANKDWDKLTDVLNEARKLEGELCL